MKNNPFNFRPVLSAVLCIMLMTCTGVMHASVSDSIPSSHTLRAANLCQQKKIDEAIREIEAAIADDEEKKDMYTWYTRGFIYKEHYKYYESADRASRSREIAVESFFKSRELLAGDDKGQGNHYTALKYLAGTYFNDALRSASYFTMENEQEMDQLLERYREIISKIEPGKNLADEEAQYYTARAQRYAELWMVDAGTPEMWDKAIAGYKRVIETIGTDCNAEYNLAILFYNRMVERYEHGEKTKADELILLSEEMFNKAIQHCPEDEESLKNSLQSLLNFKKQREAAVGNE